MLWDDIPPIVNYLYVHAPGHPLAAKNGRLPLHRWLLYRRIGDGPHPCHWCGSPVDWLDVDCHGGLLVVDHVDRNRGNNEEQNLVPSCGGCNFHERGLGAPSRRRGRFVPGPEGERFAALTDRTDGCWLWRGSLKEAGGYGHFDSDSGRVRAHRHAWRAVAGGDPGSGLHVLHICDVRHCVRNDEPGIYVVAGVAYPRFGHLWVGTHRANMADRTAKRRYQNQGGLPDRQVRGERNGSAKLTEADVREIRRLLAEGHTLRGIAATFGVSKGPITGISRGTTWKHVV